MTRQDGPRYHRDYHFQGGFGNSTFVETIPRNQAVSNLAIAATGVVLTVAVPLNFGDIVANISFVVGTTAAGTPTAGYAALRTPAGVVVATSADFGSTARAANTAYTAAMTTAYLVSTPGLYLVDISFTASTVPSLLGVSLANAVLAGAVISGMPVLAQSHGSAVGATAPATIATPTTLATIPYLIIT